MALRLPSPMLARSSAIPSGDYAFEVKWDGFRALVNRNGDFRVRSRRGWNMTALLPELADLPAKAMFDGEIVAFNDRRPHFPLVCDRLLHGNRTVPLTYVIFHVLALDGEPTMRLPPTPGRPQAAGRAVVRRRIVRRWRSSLRCYLRTAARGNRRQEAESVLPSARAPLAQGRTGRTGDTAKRSRRSAVPSSDVPSRAARRASKHRRARFRTSRLGVVRLIRASGGGSLRRASLFWRSGGSL